jgi:hypothetical protein
LFRSWSKKHQHSNPLGSENNTTKFSLFHLLTNALRLDSARGFLSAKTAAAAVLFVCVAAMSQPLLAQQSTVKRAADPIIIKGRQAEKLIGKKISDLRLYSLQNAGALKPIPYQIDERGADGAFIFAGMKDKDNGALDGNDELVFMAKDAGGKADKKLWPAKALAGVEIEITDPVDGGTAWAYLLAFPPGKAPARSSVDYVKISRNNTFIDAETYQVGFSKKAPMVFDTLVIKKSGGGPGKDVLDRLKVRFHGETLLNIKIDRNEEEFTSKTTGVLDGPVRVIRRTSNQMILIGNLPTPSSLSEQVYYNTWFVFPVIINVPLKLDVLLRNTRMCVTSESAFPPNTVFYNERNQKAVAIDGKMSAAEKALDHGTYGWQVVAGNAPPNTGAWLNRIMFDKSKTPAKIELFYVDDITKKAPPDEASGQIGNLGYMIKNIHKFGAGQHPITTYMYNLKSYKPGDEKPYLNILDKPLRARVTDK